MNIPDKFWASFKWALILVTVFLVVVSVKELKSIYYVGANPNSTNTIMVEGTGYAVAVPDIATFSFSVTETAKTVADAQDAATAKINATLKAVRDGGVADKDISTESYSINPHYEYQGVSCSVYSSVCPPSKSVLTGYDVSQSISVKVRDLKKAGALFTSIGGLGVQNIGGLTFSVDEPEMIKAQARSKAIDNAQAKAKILAKELGVSLVRIISFSENNSYYPRPVYGMGGADMMTAKAVSVAPEIPAGEQKVTDNVTITYEIK